MTFGGFLFRKRIAIMIFLGSLLGYVQAKLYKNKKEIRYL